jgi:hypothetical protein
MDFADLFIPGEPILAKILRPVIVYGFLVVSLRLAGKRELAQLNPFDLIVLLTLSNTVQHAIIGNDNSVTGGLIGAVSLLVLNYGVVRFLHRHERLDRLFGGDPVVLIEDGRVRDDRCASEDRHPRRARGGRPQAGIPVTRRGGAGGARTWRRARAVRPEARCRHDADG